MSNFPWLQDTNYTVNFNREFAPDENAPTFSSLSTNTGGNAGSVTIEVLGEKFDSQTVLTLIDESDGELLPSRMDVISSSRLLATFDLTGSNAGVYDVVATNASGSRSLEDGFTVVEGGSANIVTNISSLPAARPMTILPIEIHFANTGNIDAFNPLGRLISRGGAPIALSPQELGGNNTLDLVLQSPGDIYGVLSPGASGSITVYTQALGSLDFALSVLDDPNTPLNWDSFIPTLQNRSPKFFEDPEFTSRYWKAFRESVGENVRDLQTNLSNIQQDLWQIQKGEASSSETPLSEQNYPTVSVQDLYDIAAIEATYAASSPEYSEVSGIETTEESEETAVFQNNIAQVSTNAGSDETYKADNGKIDRWWATAGQKEPVSVTWTVKVDESDYYRLDIDIENIDQWKLPDDATVTIESEDGDKQSIDFIRRKL